MYINTMKVMMSAKMGLQKFDHFHIGKGPASGLQTQYLTNNHLEILQLAKGEKSIRVLFLRPDLLPGWSLVY